MAWGAVSGPLLRPHHMCLDGGDSVRALFHPATCPLARYPPSCSLREHPRPLDSDLRKSFGGNNVIQGGVGAGLQGKLCTCPGVVKGLALAKRVASARAAAWKQS